MANPEHVKILQQGVEVWNKWRKENPSIQPDLSEFTIENVDLQGINLSNIVGTGTWFQNVKLNSANLDQIYFYPFATEITASENYTQTPVFENVDFLGASMNRTIFDFAMFYHCKFNGAYLRKTTFQNCIMLEISMKDAGFDNVLISTTDLSKINDLDKVIHRTPSFLSLNTLIMSKGKIPIEFLEGCGVPKHVIENMQYIVDIPSIQYYSCFISYSTKDEEFCQQLQLRMKQKGLRVWFAPEEMKAGRKIHEQIYEAIRYHDKLILVLSEASMNSNWVKLEIQRARKREKEEGRRLLFPIRLMSFEKLQNWELITSEGEDLAEEIRQYYIPNFSDWKDYDSFSIEFEKLIDALQVD